MHESRSIRSEAGRLLRVINSVPMLVLILLFAIDHLLRAGNPADALGFRSVDIGGLPERIEMCKREDPDFVLVGSSLLMVLHQDPSSKHCHTPHPNFLEQKLSTATHESIKAIGLCSGLQMPSETYFISQAVTDSRKHPAVIFYGISLRDTIDDRYAPESRTESFQSVAPYVPLCPDVWEISTQSAAREFCLSHFWYLYRNRTDFKNILSAFAKDGLEYLPLDLSFNRTSLDGFWKPQRHGYLWETWVARHNEEFGERVFRKDPAFFKQLNLRTQNKVHAGGSPMTKKLEWEYLHRLMSLCRRHSVQLVLLNMPASPEHRLFVPRESNDTFRSALSALTRYPGTTVIDYYDDGSFKSDDFKDGLHLTYEGTCKLTDKLIAELQSRHPEVLAAMARHARMRESR